MWQHISMYTLIQNNTPLNQTFLNNIIILIRFIVFFSYFFLGIEIKFLFYLMTTISVDFLQ